MAFTMARRQMHLRLIRTAAVLLGFAASTFTMGAAAGIWKGDVTKNGRPAAGASITICGVPAATDSSGNFRISVPGNPKSCPVLVSYEGKSSSEAKVRSSPYLSLSLRSSSKGWVVEVK